MRGGVYTKRTENAPRFYFYLWKVEAARHPCLVTDEPKETLAQLIARIKRARGVSEPQIAAAIGASTSAVNAWASGARGRKRGPRTVYLEALAEAYKGTVTRDEVFAAAQVQVPGPLDPDAEERVLAVYRELTEEQRKMTLTQMRALAEENRTGQ
jgi:transcriptional regulator with XRE-family HTH domain